MHALLARAYHLTLFAIHIVTRPVWRPLAACLVLAILGRLLTREDGSAKARFAHAGLAAGGAVLVGWLVLAGPAGWPLSPVARLSGLAAIVLADAMLRARGWHRWVVAPLTACLAAWWLRGAPFTGPGIANCVPVIFGLLAALALARRLTRGDEGWGTLAAAIVLAGALRLSGAATHWAIAATVPALASLAMLGVPEAQPVLANLVVMVAGAALVASDRGKLVAVDVACVLPLLALGLVPRLERRVGRHRPVVASFLAIATCVALAWGAAEIIPLR